MDSDIIKAIILGIVQGVTEFFPVSSTAHLILFPWLFGWKGEVDTLTFDIALHAGTLVALIACFCRDWIDLFLKNRRLLAFIIVATVPAGVAGVLLHDLVEHDLRHPLVIVVTLILFGLLMLYAEQRYGASNRGDFKRLSLLDALFIGCAQAVALLPGVSRSGITITSGLFRSLTRESAARFSFLLSTPVIGGATLLGLRKVFRHPEAYHVDVFAAGFVSALVSGIFAITFLMSYLKHHRLNAFVYYRLVLAGVIMVAYLR